MPTKSSFSPGPTRSGTDALRKDCNSAWEKPTKATVVGPQATTGLVGGLGGWRFASVEVQTSELSDMITVSLSP